MTRVLTGWMAVVCLVVLPCSTAAQNSRPTPSGRYLGQYSTNRFAGNSLSNPYGRYGSRFSGDSINNPFGRYGGCYGSEGVRNAYGRGVGVWGR